MKNVKNTKKTVQVEETSTTKVEEPKVEVVTVVSEFESADKSLKAVLKMNKLTSLYEIDFYKNGKFVVSESYAYHTRRYHEDAAENYVNGIKKI